MITSINGDYIREVMVTSKNATICSVILVTLINSNVNREVIITRSSNRYFLLVTSINVTSINEQMVAFLEVTITSLM